jgi:hypothetical protein
MTHVDPEKAEQAKRTKQFVSGILVINKGNAG